MLLVLAQQQW